MRIPSRTGVTAGVTAGSQEKRAPSRRVRRATVAALVATGLVSSSVLMPGLAAAAIPTFPDNVVVFPDRDFVTIEGYQDHVGQTATVEVWRGDQIVGSAQGVVEAGDVAFEINHPGGYCWGAGTNLKVTPDIKPNDRVSIRFGTAANADADDSTVVADAMVDVDSELTGDTLIVTGKIAAGLETARTEQRIVNPALTDTAVARRDIRAVPGPLTAAARGGYSSMLEFPTAGTFKATYVFSDLEAAQLAATGGGERFMYWQVEDPAANRQGLTIAEYGELGGPGMGGCPAGPADAGAPAGTAQVIRAADGLSAQINWTPTTAVPGAAAVSGYSVLAVAPAGTDPAAPLAQVGVRVGATAKQASVSGLTKGTNYTFEVRSIADGSMSKPFTIGTATAPGGGQTQGAEAVLTLNPAGGTDTEPKATGLVTATGNSAGQVWYTDDGKPAVTGDLLADTAKLYTAPVPVPATATATAPLNLHFAFFNADGNVGQASGYYMQGQSQTAPAAPANLAQSNVLQDRVSLTWAAVAGATGYQIEATPALAAPIPATVATTQTVTGLAPNTDYSFTVKAKNAEGTLSGPSNVVTFKTPAASDRLTVASARFKAGDFRISGTGTENGATVTLFASNAAGVVGAQIGTPTTIALNAYEFRIRTNVPNPGYVVVKSNRGGVSAPFRVTT